MLIELDNNIHWVIILMGVLLALSLAVKAFLKAGWLTPITAFLSIGIFLRLGNDLWNFLPPQAAPALDFLGQLGIIVILFDAGMKCHIKSLISQIKKASLIVFGDIIISGLFGFSVSYLFLDIELIPSFFISAALVATSIGVTVIIWESSGKLQSKTGQLLMDLAILDDIAGIILMAFLFELAPVIHHETHSEVFHTFYAVLGVFLLKFISFIVLGQIFSHFIETRLVQYLKKWEPFYDRTITILSIGFIIAGIAYYFGFSLALGAFFAGIAFSSNPEAVRLESSFKTFEDFFGPFFFISIGFQVSLIIVTPSLLGIIAILFAAAAAGKYLGNMTPAILSGIKFSEASLLGISMIPRAEITMIILAKGVSLGPWAVSESIYTATVIAALLTCLIGPLALHPLLARQGEPDNREHRQGLGKTPLRKE